MNRALASKPRVDSLNIFENVKLFFRQLESLTTEGGTCVPSIYAHVFSYGTDAC